MSTESEAKDGVLLPGMAKSGVLLVHGLNGSISDMSEIEEMLRKNGFVTRNLLLPGHGSHVRDMLQQGWPEWVAAVRAAYRGLRHQCKHVFLIGHSLGGALCLHLAAHEKVEGVVSMCSPISMRPWLRPLIRAGKYLWPLVPTVREDVRDPAARQRYTRDVYRWTAMSPVESMMNYLPTLRAELPRVTAPALIMVARHDHVVSARDGREIYHLIRSPEKHFVTFHHSYHVIMKDLDREEVFAKIEAFILRHAHHMQRHPF
ncbi:MAG TPA: alpha/beta fold hydrolase [Ktedonobacteraceae bacterium]